MWLELMGVVLFLLALAELLKSYFQKKQCLPNQPFPYQCWRLLWLRARSSFGGSKARATILVLREFQ
ncbi:unnamed protein product, partial [Cyprideis torosa]